MRASDRLASLATFYPRRLRATRTAVQAEHPGTASIPAPLLADVTNRVRQLVESQQDDREGLKQLARGFSPRDMRACIVGLEDWEHIRSALVIVIRTKPMGTMVPALWGSWQRSPFVEEIATLLSELGGTFGMERAVGAAFAQASLNWISPVKPGRRIAGWLDTGGRTYSDLEKLSDSPFTEDTPLLRDVRDAVMTDGSASQLRAEGAGRLLKWFRELAASEQPRFERNSLMKLSSAEWHPDVVELIHRRNGLPRNPRRPAFWEPVPQKIQDEFQRIVIERILSEAFGDDTDRHRYWKMRLEVDTPKDIAKGKAGTTAYVVIDFGPFLVVEFFEHGNAAYFYSRDQYERVERGSVRHPSALKTKHPSPRGFGDNRLIHQPKWQRRADRMLQTWRTAYK